MNIARTIIENALCPHSHHLLRCFKFSYERIASIERCSAQHSEALGFVRPADKEQSNIGVLENCSQAFEHSIAIVVGKSEFSRASHPHEAGHPAFVGHIGPALPGNGGEEEHRRCLNDLAMRL